MKVSLRTVMFLCTLLLGMQLGALVHASEHIQDIDHVACQLCSHLDRFDESAPSASQILDKVKTVFILGVSPQAHLVPAGAIFYKRSRAPPALNIS
ncbi:MAG: hypothetical protein V7785_05125 [Bermanella sp.]